MLFIISTPAIGEVTIKDIRIWQGPESSRLVFDVNDRLHYRLFFLSNPERILVDLKSVKIDAAMPKKLKPPLTKIRQGKAKKDVTRIVIELTTPSKASSFLLDPQEQYGHRLVVDITPNTNQKPTVSTVEKNRDVLIAIDAGHGGEDYGAVAPGVNEKTLVLAYSKALAKELNQRFGMKAMLIREGDYFIPLHKRMLKARANNADLFISVHANSFPKDKKVNGFMLFALSERGASSATAKWLEKSENLSNSRGGINSVLENEINDFSLRKVILDLSMTSVLNQSILAGRSILANVSEVTKLHKREVETANFAVLRALDVPALLLELGFLSSPNEVSKLQNGNFQQRMIVALANGIEAFFYDYPPYGSRLAQARSEQLKNPELFYAVQQNDTLSQISLEKNVSVADLKKLNNLINDNILAGQKLRLREDPNPSLPPPQPGLPDKYQVKVGDSLWTIAARFGLTVQQLQNLNKLEKRFIYPGQKLLLYK